MTNQKLPFLIILVTFLGMNWSLAQSLHHLSPKNTERTQEAAVLSKIQQHSVLQTNNMEAAPASAPMATGKMSNFGGGNGGMNPQAMWDIQFNHNIPLSGPSFAGVVWTGTEFWVSKWNGNTATGIDSLFVFDQAGVYLGSFTITGGNTVAGSSIRGMTTDGTNVYVCNNSTTVRRVSIATQAVVGSFILPATVGAGRWITYDGSGTPGFWVGNFNTDLFKIDNPATTGATATVNTTIAAATHGLSGMYGGAYDGTSTGGPYLWMFCQTDPAGGTSQGVIAQVALPAGTYTNIYRNVDADFGSTGGLAGGLGIALLPGYTQRTLFGVLQGVNLFGYELNFVNSAITDIAADSLDPTNGLTIWPVSQNGPITFGFKKKNVGTVSTSNIASNVKVYDGANTLLNTYTFPAATLAAGGSAVTTTSPTFTASGIDIYTALGAVDVTGDNNAANDTVPALFIVDDSTFSRDYASFGIAVGGLGVGSGSSTQPRLGQAYTLATADQLTTITAYFSGPSAGDFTSLSIYNDVAGSPGTLLGSTSTYTFTQTDQDSGVVLTLPLTSGPLNLPAGTFWAVVNEGDSIAGLATTPYIYTPGKHKVIWSTMSGGAVWTDVGAFGATFKRAFVVRPNFGGVGCTTTLLSSVTTTNTNCGANTGSATVTISNGATPYAYSWSNGQVTQTATNLGTGAATCVVTDANGCVATATATIATNPLTVGVTTSAAGCGQANGSATATVTGFTGAVTYSWSNGQTTANLMNVAAGSYTVIATSSQFGCVGTAVANVANSGGPTVTATATNPLCFGQTGTATAQGTGGTGNLTYSWTSGAAGQTASNLAAGSYTVYVVDLAGCLSSANVTITVPPAIVVNTTSTNPNCFGSNTGVATAQATGGTGNLTYSWSNGLSGQTISNLAPGSYVVTVKDANNCTSTSQVAIVAPTQLTVGVTTTFNSATANAAGGTPPYTYTWSTTPQQTTQTATGLNPGTYTVQVKDSKGCIVSGSGTINVGIDFATLGIETLSTYPNPNNGTFTVDVQLSNTDNVTFEIFDLTGKSVFQVERTNVLSVTEKVELNNISSGIYLMTVKTSKGATNLKLVVE